MSSRTRALGPHVPDEKCVSLADSISMLLPSLVRAHREYELTAYAAKYELLLEEARTNRDHDIPFINQQVADHVDPLIVTMQENLSSKIKDVKTIIFDRYLYQGVFHKSAFLRDIECQIEKRIAECFAESSAQEYLDVDKRLTEYLGSAGVPVRELLDEPEPEALRRAFVSIGHALGPMVRMPAPLSLKAWALGRLEKLLNSAFIAS